MEIFSPYLPSRYFSCYEPDVETGLIGVGGMLYEDWLIDAYTHGIFPWPIPNPYEFGGDDKDMLLAWFSPDPRAIFEYDKFHVSRRLERLCNSGRFQIRTDADFSGVIRGCSSAQERQNATWITPQMIEAYINLHKAGYAHSVEAWCGGRLAGGVYGVAIGGLFAAESMFYVEPNASKVALVALIKKLKKLGFMLIDIQEITPNTQRFGAIEISRKNYIQRLHEALKLKIKWE
ncbi:MAG: leucyl/phenylalanyl-tRNA--protein transferase [Planctomycetaceae bacterium]|jgi:leucyl/phenylalanyl-tRNA--protein transferase|nr:leucyl/phenylalanyl-tRNA--protein transferase [Planctomycetaceae bacterium]